MYQRILVPVDGSATAMNGLREAIRLARLNHGRLLLVHCVDSLSHLLSAGRYATLGIDWRDALYKEGDELLARAAAMATAEGIEVETAVVDNGESAIAESVAHEAQTWSADLVVIGTHGRRGATRFVLGSDAEKILRLAPVPVLLVRAPATGPSSSAMVSLPSEALSFE